jgi:excisionase family DNA binding protein
MGKLFTLAEAAIELHLTRRRINQFVADKRLRAGKKGDMWLIREEDLEKFKSIKRRGGYPKGRPKKPISI